MLVTSKWSICYCRRSSKGQQRLWRACHDRPPRLNRHTIQRNGNLSLACGLSHCLVCILKDVDLLSERIMKGFDVMDIKHDRDDKNTDDNAPTTVWAWLLSCSPSRRKTTGSRRVIALANNQNLPICAWGWCTGITDNQRATRKRNDQDGLKTLS